VRWSANPRAGSPSPVAARVIVGRALVAGIVVPARVGGSPTVAARCLAEPAGAVAGGTPSLVSTRAPAGIEASEPVPCAAVVRVPAGGVEGSLTTLNMVATGNAGKLREIRELLADARVSLRSLAEFSGLAPRSRQAWLKEQSWLVLDPATNTGARLRVCNTLCHGKPHPCEYRSTSF